MTSDTVTAIITTIPPRADQLTEALASVHAQTHPPDAVVVTVDTERRGPAPQRNDAVYSCPTLTRWVAFLDDDDIWYPQHLAVLLDAADTTGADVVYPWFELRDAHGRDINVHDPLFIGGERAFGRPFDETARTHLLTTGNFIPVTALVRRSAFLAVGGFPTPGTPEWPHTECEDWGLWQRLAQAGASFHHVPERTWEWRWHGRNTSGRTDRW